MDAARNFARNTVNKPAYVSGITVLNPQELADALMQLEAHKAATLGDSTLDRKRKKIHARAIQTERATPRPSPLRLSTDGQAGKRPVAPERPRVPVKTAAPVPAAKKPSASIRIQRRLVLNVAVLMLLAAMIWGWIVLRPSDEQHGPAPAASDGVSRPVPNDASPHS